MLEQMIYNASLYIILPFLISIVSAFVFWILTFKCSNIKIIFSNRLEKKLCSLGAENKQYLYRIRLTNIRRRDLIEVSLIAKITIEENGKINSTYFPVGDECIVPVIFGKKTNREVKKNNLYDFETQIPRYYKIQYYGLYINDIAYREYSKDLYKDCIKSKATKKELLLDDIFEAYPNTKMKIYMFGNDSVTGARRKFESKTYCKEDIIEGGFVRFYSMLDKHKKLEKAKGKKKIRMLEEMLSVIEKDELKD